ncbi:hypothetical protein WICMUC_005926 [Wickerhamomyces mucosus]|uniref:Major facilitator superfamily (MFS) profile domain-containing protein n=1 Tax=Wickerhamomyces mucosus TaxID=1378264 RepID=A0A9P8P1L6_9ASCO|nr:hypothetical protein WICMUC_005926 [Wickerhamomyces mucosus]
MSDTTSSKSDSGPITENIDIQEKKLNNIDEEKQPVPAPSPPYSAFTTRRKSFIIFLVTFAGFLGPVSGNIYIPILPQLQDVFDCSETTINATVSVFMAVFAVSPLLWAVWADFGGRKTLYLTSLVFYILSNILLAAIPANIAALFVLRISQAFGASSVMSVGAGTVADIIPAKDRGKAMSYFMLGPQLGPVLGPILSLIATNGNWRWIFGFLSIIGGIIYLLIVFCLPETLRYLVGNGEELKLSGPFVKPKYTQPKLVENFPKPPKPSLKNYWSAIKFMPVLLCSLNSGFLFASFYGISVTFTRILKDDYGFSQLARSLSYICPGLSLISGSLIGGRLSDYLRRRAKNKNPTKYTPEQRFSIQIVGLAISIAGILGYGWCVDKHIHVVAVFVFTFLAGFGMTWVFITTTTYLTEVSSAQPATNVAIANFARNASAAISSVIIDRLVEQMGFGWCFTGLAFVNLIGIFIVLLVIYRGPTWRSKRDPK